MQKADQVLSYSGAPRCPPATARAIGAGLSASTPPPQPHCCARAGYPLQSLARVAVLSVVAATSLAQSITPVPFAQTRLTDRFWAPRLATHASTTLPICIDQTEVKTGRIRNFEKAAAGLGQHEGMYYDDSDVYKVLEGMAYSLINNPNPALEKKCDEWIDKIVAAQQEDGYLNTYYTLTNPAGRWADMEKHEDYCAGHLIEAAIAYYQATGKRVLLDAAIRLADHLTLQVGPGKKNWVPGHQEIELALIKLYRITHQDKYLSLAYWMLEQRGNGFGKGMIWSNPAFGAAYCQDDVPARHLANISGHAVRAMYQYSAMADVQSLRTYAGYTEPLQRVWHDVVDRNMYITGGIGSSRQNEGFTTDYDLPNATAYCETCASIGMVFWNHRMFLGSGESKYIDVLERSLYNGSLAGVSLSGDRFFYVNPLESGGTHHRKEWFDTACCPSNVSRLLPALGDYLYAQREDEVWVNLFIGNETKLQVGKTQVVVVQKTDYPWNGTVRLNVRPDQTLPLTLHLRIPGWNKQRELLINGQPTPALKNEYGYITLTRTWQAGDQLELLLDMPVEVVSADHRVKANVGKRALQRGPLVYCLEEADNPGVNFNTVRLSPRNKWTVREQADLLNQVTVLQTAGLTFVPYYAWDNRAPGNMKVWIDWNE